MKESYMEDRLKKLVALREGAVGIQLKQINYQISRLSSDIGHLKAKEGI
ncbi:MAG: hypothetical protein U9N61_10435 [Euryarchaeota archaeon]|nr:hypothetical protein [Euryarchaeota archaeon]